MSSTLLAILGILLVGLVLFSWIVARGVSPRSKAALPSHYNPERYMRRPPGYCLDCGAENDPQYRYCQSCASEFSRSMDESE